MLFILIDCYKVSFVVGASPRPESCGYI